MPSLLFVDDEPNVLNGLRRMLRDKRREWAMRFVADGEAALAAIAEEPVDVVVSDLRMPGMDGVALLDEFRQRSPATMRVALSGHADREATLRAITQIHQFISKPCTPEKLREVLTRALSLRAVLNNERLRELVTQMTQVPSVDDLHSRVVRQLDRPDASLGEVGQCIAREPGLSTKVLQLVNSAVFGLPQMVADPTHATVLLGLDVIRTLVLSIRVFEAVPDSSVEGLTAAAVWRHSVAVARLAKRIALAEGRDEYVAECAFLGGLLHDIGKLVLAANLPERYLSVRKLGNGHCARTCGVERKVFGGSHGEVGAYLIGLWGFPDSVLEAIAWHHAPSRCVHEPFSPLTSVHVANTLLACPDPAAHGCLDHDYLARAGIAERIPAWQRMAEEALEKEAVV